MLMNLPLRSSVCSPAPEAPAGRGARRTDAKSCPTNGSPSSARGRIAFLNFTAGVQHQHPPRQALDQSGQPRGQVLLAGVRLAQFGAQLRDLGAQRVEGAGQLFRHRTEGEKCCLQFGATVFNQLKIGGCHAGGRKQLLCLGGISSFFQPVTPRRMRLSRTASIICRAV
jgi:hypothetical protein